MQEADFMARHISKIGNMACQHMRLFTITRCRKEILQLDTYPRQGTCRVNTCICCRVNSSTTRCRKEILQLDISKIENMAWRLHDLGEHIFKSMQFTKIVCSYNVVSCAWDNIPPNEQTINALVIRHLKEESLVKMQSGSHMANANNFIFLSVLQERYTSLMMKISDYFKKLKKKTKCNINWPLG